MAGVAKWLRDGMTGQRLLLAGLVSLYALGVGLALWESLASLGRPDLGWHVQWNQVSPTREDSARAGLRGGAQRACRLVPG